MSKLYYFEDWLLSSIIPIIICITSGISQGVLAHHVCCQSPGERVLYTRTFVQGSSRQICLEVGEDRLQLSTRPKLYLLDLDLPYLLDPDSTGAQFNIHTTTLTATLHVTGLAPTLS
jgi:hypothetical protein